MLLEIRSKPYTVGYLVLNTSLYNFISLCYLIDGFVKRILCKSSIQFYEALLESVNCHS